MTSHVIHGPQLPIHWLEETPGKWRSWGDWRRQGAMKAVTLPSAVKAAAEGASAGNEASMVPVEQHTPLEIREGRLAARKRLIAVSEAEDEGQLYNAMK